LNQTDISAKQMMATITMFMVGSSLITGGSDSAKQDNWVCILAAAVLVIPLVWIHSEILNLYPGRAYFRNIIRAMGRPLGIAVCALLTLYILHLGGMVLRVFSEFIHVVNMTETPMIAIAVGIITVMIYLLSNRIYVLTRISKFMVPIMCVIIVMTLLLSYKNMDFNNLKPILQSEPSALMKGTVSAAAVMSGEIMMCAPMFGAMDRKKNVFSTMLNGALFGFLIIVVVSFRNRLVLGYISGISIFPSYEAVSVIQLGEFFTRIEVLIGILLLLVGFVKICVLMFSACEALSSTVGLNDYEPLVVPVGLLLLTIASLVHADSIEMSRWIKMFPLYSFPFQVLLPVLVLIVGKIRKRAAKPKKPKTETAKEEKTSASQNLQEG
jgi:spore germination protein KB